MNIRWLTKLFNKNLKSRVVNKKPLLLAFGVLICFINLGIHLKAQEILQNSRIKADEIIFHADGSFTALGAVEFSTENILFQSPKVIFDGINLEVFGPVYTTNEDGDVTKFEYAKLSDETKEMFLQSVKALYNRQLQIVAESEYTSEDGYVIFNNVAVTTCPVCEVGEELIWYFRADSLTTDPEENRIYLKNARFRLFGNTLMSLPWLSLANPAKGNASGFLFPEISYSKGEKLTVIIPYYVSITSGTDIEILTGYNSKNKDLEFGYHLRNRFKNGWIDLSGATPLTNEKLINIDFTLKGQWEIDPNNVVSFLGTNTSGDNNNYPPGLFPNKYSLVFSEYTNTSTFGRSTVRAISIDPLNDEPSLETRNSLNTIASFRFQSNDLLPRTPFYFGYRAELQTINNNYGQPEFNSGSFLIEARKINTFDFGLSVTNQIFLLGQEFEINNDPEMKHKNHTKAVMATDLNFPLIYSGNKTTHIVEPFLQFVIIDENNTDNLYLKDRRWGHWQEFDRSILISPYQINTIPGRGDGNEINIGVKYSVFDAKNSYELSLGRAYKDNRNEEPFDRKVFFEGTDKEVYVGELKVNLDSQFDATMLGVWNNNFSTMRYDLQLNYTKDFVKVGLGLESIKIDHVEFGNYLRRNNRISEEYENPPDPKSVQFNIEYPVNDKVVAFSNINYDQTKIASRKIEAGLLYAYNCIAVKTMVTRTNATLTQPKSNTEWKINFMLTSLTAGKNNKCNS